MNNFNISKAEKYFFTLISYITHPILIPSFGLYVILVIFSKYYNINITYLIKFEILYFIMTAIIPFIIILLFYYFKFIESFYLKNKEERLLVSLTMTIFYFFTYYFTRQIYFHQNILIYITSVPITSFIFSLIVAFNPTISMHAFVWGALCGIVLFYWLIIQFVPNPFLIITLTIFSGLIITARLILNAHNFKEVLSGFFYGIIIGFGVILTVFLM